MPEGVYAPTLLLWDGTGGVQACPCVSCPPPTLQPLSALNQDPPPCCLGEGKLRGALGEGTKAKAPPYLGSELGPGFLQSTGKIERLPEEDGPGCSCPGKQRELGLLPSLHPSGFLGHPR